MSESKRHIVFATNNPNKLKEIRQIVGDQWHIVSLDDINCREEIEETAETIAGNALLKARYVAEHYGLDCFADDTGLEVEALGGAPGVNTARYASALGHDSNANIDKLLGELKGKENRRARFLTVIALVRKGNPDVIIEGECRGSIATERRGCDGFGYDPVFLPDEAGGLSFAQISSHDKNAISHRGRATRKLVEYLNGK